MLSGLASRAAFRKKVPSKSSTLPRDARPSKPRSIASRLFLARRSRTPENMSSAKEKRASMRKNLKVERKKSNSLSPSTGRQSAPRMRTFTPSPMQQHKSFPPYNTLSVDSEDGLAVARKRSGTDERLNKQEAEEGRHRSDSDSKSKWTLATRFGINVTQKKAIVTSWQRLCDFGNPRPVVLVMEAVFQSSSRSSKLGSMFVSSAFVHSMNPTDTRNRVQTVRDHAKFFTWFLAKIVENLDKDPKEILDEMGECGSQHSHLKALGFKTLVWEKFGQQLIDHLVIQDGVRHCPYAAKSWTVLIAGVVDMMCSGFIQPKRKRSQPCVVPWEQSLNSICTKTDDLALAKR